jgi:CxxC motif-containing protein (DUF1111 family)
MAGSRRRRIALLAVLLTVGLITALAWLTASSASADDVAPAGGPDGPSAHPPDLVQAGEILFARDLTVEQGLGPLYNDLSCAGCHLTPRAGGMGRDGVAVVTRVGRLVDGTFEPLAGRGGPVARAHAISELGASCPLTPGIPAEANLTSVRNTPPLFGLGLIEQIPDEAILALAVPRGDGVHGRANLVPDEADRQRVGRFGWKGDTATLERFVADALRNEHGVTSPLAPTDLAPPGAQVDTCSADQATPEDDGAMVAALAAFIAALPAPTSIPDPDGERLFAATGCTACHVPALPTANGEARLYSDLLLHDVGPALDDGVRQGVAAGRDWRTTPLWGLRQRQRFLHDGRARTIEAAIRAHGGEAEVATRRFAQLPPSAQAALLDFLGSR